LHKTSQSDPGRNSDLKIRKFRVARGVPNGDSAAVFDNGVEAMSFRYIGLSPKPFAPLRGLSDEELLERGLRRMIVDEKPGFPCRVTLEDAEVGEHVLLLPFEHQPARSPYRASGPIFVREDAQTTCDYVGAPPRSLLSRMLSVRAYAQDGMMVDADVTPGEELEPLLERFFTDPAVAYVHVHYARRGCYAARVERAAA
jgi:hypothetical protein